mmetsp:Transcript_2128/g.13910  ORF Transcript_2128/g.13910 Transcript_2128/m.13910 type:complete len:204 (-) Transcript_2128:3332-3943(-)
MSHPTTPPSLCVPCAVSLHVRIHASGNNSCPSCNHPRPVVPLRSDPNRYVRPVSPRVPSFALFPARPSDAPSSWIDPCLLSTVSVRKVPRELVGGRRGLHVRRTGRRSRRRCATWRLWCRSCVRFHLDATCRRDSRRKEEETRVRARGKRHVRDGTSQPSPTETCRNAGSMTKDKRRWNSARGRTRTKVATTKRKCWKETSWS